MQMQQWVFDLAGGGLLPHAHWRGRQFQAAAVWIAGQAMQGGHQVTMMTELCAMYHRHSIWLTDSRDFSLLAKSFLQWIEAGLASRGAGYWDEV